MLLCLSTLKVVTGELGVFMITCPLVYPVIVACQNTPRPDADMAAIHEASWDPTVTQACSGLSPVLPFVRDSGTSFTCFLLQSFPPYYLRSTALETISAQQSMQLSALWHCPISVNAGTQVAPRI